MDPSPATVGPDARPVIYAGRFADLLTEPGLPEGWPVLDEWDVLPSSLAAAMKNATALAILDPFSFPFEAMTKEQWDVPLILSIPSGFDAGFLRDVFGEPVFERLGFFDFIATWDSGVWEDLSRRYRWTESQHVALSGDDPNEAVSEIRALLEEGVADLPEREDYEAFRYLSERGDQLASSAPHRAILVGRHGPAKAVHRVQAAALEPQFAAAHGGRAGDVPFDVLEVGAGTGRWVSSFDPGQTRFVGVDISEGMTEAARANFPEASFDRIERDLLLPYDDESFDLAFTVSVLHHNPAPAKRTLISGMWRVVRPGGRLLFLEDFVAERRSKGSTIYPMSVLRFVELVFEATAGQVVLEHVESVRYPGDDVVRGGVISLSRLGVPRRW